MRSIVAELSHGRARKIYHPWSKFFVLRRFALAWYQRSVWRAVLLEIRGTHHRIRRLLRTKLHRTGLCFEPVYRSVPRLADYDSCTERQPYILGIQALAKDRPWMTLSDAELFLQGWFQAERCVLGIPGTESEIPVEMCASCSSSELTGKWFMACPLCVARMADRRISEHGRPPTLLAARLFI
jgi:hypothetical protein